MDDEAAKVITDFARLLGDHVSCKLTHWGRVVNRLKDCLSWGPDEILIAYVGSRPGETRFVQGWASASNCGRCLCHVLYCERALVGRLWLKVHELCLQELGK